jgi:hypothetical protein
VGAVEIVELLVGEHYVACDVHFAELELMGMFLSFFG